MLRSSFCALLLLASFSPAQTSKPEAKPAARPLLETWQAAYFEGLKVGHMHTVPLPQNPVTAWAEKAVGIAPWSPAEGPAREGSCPRWFKPRSPAPRCTLASPDP
jgi:hypothetical protein